MWNTACTSRRGILSGSTFATTALRRRRRPTLPRKLVVAAGGLAPPRRDLRRAGRVDCGRWHCLLRRWAGRASGAREQPRLRRDGERARALQIGRESGGVSQYGGGLDELRLWNVARTPSQLQAHMAAELSAIEPGLIGYWKFNEGTGTTAADDAGNGLTATLFNSPTWTAGGPVSTLSQAAITSASATSFPVSEMSSFTITATGSPTIVLQASGALPAGVTMVDHGDGTASLAGTPQVG